MNLVIDIGNTLTKAGIFTGDSLVKEFTFSTFSEEEIIHSCKQFEVTNSLVSSVVNGIKTELLSEKFPVMIFSHQLSLPFRNLYKTPETLGNDRLANVAAVSFLYPSQNILIVDAGTCIKTDFLSKDGIYKGGSISPGLHMRFKALNQFTSRLPLVKFRYFDAVTGSSTEESILSGVLNGIRFEIKGFINTYNKEYRDLIVVFTGGDSSFFDSTLKNSIFVAPNLALTGLNIILNYNVEKNKI